jgi:hypothetical protein
MILEAGPDADDLKIHIVGDNGDTIEAFFNDGLYRETFPTPSYLQFDRIVLAPRSRFGTFAVRYGSARDTLKAYGWATGSTGKPPAVYGPIQLMPGYPINPQWVTPTILKVRFGPNWTQDFILKFTSAGTWQILYDGRVAPSR